MRLFIFLLGCSYQALALDLAIQCRNGDPDSCARYGYEKQEAKDIESAIHYYEEGCILKHGGACNNLASIFRDQKKTEESILKYKLACQYGFKPACVKIEKLNAFDNKESQKSKENQ